MHDEIEDVDPESLAAGLTAKQTADVLRDVARERVRQDERFGWFRDFPDGTDRNEEDATEARWLREECNRRTATGAVTWRDIAAEEMAEVFAESDGRKLEAELIQTAAVCVAWVEALRRRRGAAGSGMVPPLSWWRRLLRRIGR